MRALKLTLLFCFALAGSVTSIPASAYLSLQDDQAKSDPASWGGDHVGKPMPDYYGGDECLFCHRFTVGLHWQKDAHFRTVRGKYKDAKIAPEIEWLKTQEFDRKYANDVDLILGGGKLARFLRRNDRGEFEILSAGMRDPQSVSPTRFSTRARAAWDDKVFAARCIGCHMTGVDQQTMSPFESFVGCEACHGPHNPAHTNGSIFMRFAKKAKEEARVIASTCGSCHLRAGESRSTGRPYPNNFVAGDNLFKDYQFDFTKETRNPPGNLMDAHIVRNIREIVVNGNNDLTCLSCHKMHPADSFKHRRQPKTDYCYTCHETEPFKERKKYESHSATCEY